MKRAGGILLICAALLAGCRRDDPVETVGTPVFSLQATINNNPVSIQAGVNGYFMHTSYASDVNAVTTFTGDLNAGALNNSLRIHISDYRDHLNSPTDIDSSLRAASYLYADTAMQFLSNTIAFTALPVGDSVISCLWDFGDSFTSTQLNTTHSYNTPGAYLVCLSINYLNNSIACSNSICDTVYVGVQPCMTVDIFSTALPPDTFLQIDTMVYSALVSGGTGPYTYNWDFGDQSTGSGSAVAHGYQQAGRYTVALSVSDALGCSASRRRNVRTFSNDSCVTNFDWQQVVTGNTLFSRVTIEWTDASGVTWRSDGGSQSMNSSFTILSVSEFELNSAGQRTKKIHALATCTLYNGSNSIQFTNADITFAVAYP